MAQRLHLGQPDVVAQLMKQLTNNSKFKGLNPASGKKYYIVVESNTSAYYANGFYNIRPRS